MSAPFPAIVTESGLRFEDGASLKAYVHGKWGVGEVVLVSVDDYSELRSLLQNNYLHSEPIKKFCEWTGNTPAQMKVVLLGEYFGWTTVDGHEVPVKPSTSELTKKEFAEWVEWLVQFGAEHGLNILPPEKDPAKRDPRVLVE